MNTPNLKNTHVPSGTAPAKPATLEQQRAQFAWQCAQEGVQVAGAEYRNLAKAAPALIMNNGLMQTLAFYQDKNKDHHRELAAQLRSWIMVRLGDPDPDVRFEAVMRFLLDSDSSRYRQATDEALLILRWIRQFAAAL